MHISEDQNLPRSNDAAFVKEQAVNHDRNCASRWQASSECDCGADRVNAEEAIHTLEARLAKLEPIVDLAAKWYLAGDKQPQAQRDLEDALHLYLELT